MTPEQVVVAYDALHRLERMREKAKEIDAILSLPDLRIEISDGDRNRLRLDVPRESILIIRNACQDLVDRMAEPAYKLLLEAGVDDPTGLWPKLSAFVLPEESDAP